MSVPSFYHHCTHAFNAPLLARWFNRTNILFVLALPTLPFISHSRTMVIFLKLKCKHITPAHTDLPVSLQSLVFSQCSSECPSRLHSFIFRLISAFTYFSVYSLRLRGSIFELYIASKFYPVSGLFLRFSLFLNHFPPAIWSHTLIDIANFYSPCKTLPKKRLLSLSSEQWLPLTWCSKVRLTGIKS